VGVKAALVRVLGDLVDLQLRFLTAREVQRSSQYRLFTLYQRTDRLQQLQMLERWARLESTTGKALPFEDVAFSVYSGNGEDGILLYLLHVLGAGTKKIVDIGGSDGVAGNSCNLVLNHGFEALIVDGSTKFVNAGKRFYSRCPLLFNNPPTFALGMITRENIRETLSAHGFEGDLDILSIDIDGHDLQILEAATNIRPRIIVLEFNTAFGPDESVVFPYDQPRSDRFLEGFFYGGASLAAFTKALKARDFRLVGVDPSGQDAYFVSNACPSAFLPERSLSDCYRGSLPWQRAVKAAANAAVRTARWDQY
jgi:hypothetical protein